MFVAGCLFDCVCLLCYLCIIVDFYLIVLDCFCLVFRFVILCYCLVWIIYVILHLIVVVFSFMWFVGYY